VRGVRGGRRGKAVRDVVGGGGGVLLVRGREGREGAQPIVLGGDLRRGGGDGDLRGGRWI